MTGPNLSGGAIAQDIVYSLLVLFWCAVFGITIVYAVQSSNKNWPSEYRRILLLLVGVSGVLFIDSGYWAAANFPGTGLLPKAVESTLREHGLVAVEKSLVLISGVAFLALVLTSTTHLEKRVEQFYFSRFVEQTWDAIGVLDPSGRMRLWNSAAVRLFGWEPDEVIGRDIREFMVPEDQRGEIDQTLRDARFTKIAQRRMRSIRRTKDGKRIPVDILITPNFNNEEFQGYFGIMRRAMPNSLADYWKFNRADTEVHPFGGIRYAFVAMPFSTEIVSKDTGSLINEAITECGLTPYRTDYGQLSQPMNEHISTCIAHAEFVVAVLTGGNLNVYYELGMAHGFGQKVIQLVTTNEIEALPFDIANIRTIAYDPSDLSGMKRQLKAWIQKTLGDASLS